jgi:hypothetical protein
MLCRLGYHISSKSGNFGSGELLISVQVTVILKNDQAQVSIYIPDVILLPYLHVNYPIFICIIYVSLYIYSLLHVSHSRDT